MGEVLHKRLMIRSCQGRIGGGGGIRVTNTLPSNLKTVEDCKFEHFPHSCGEKPFEKKALTSS